MLACMWPISDKSVDSTMTRVSDCHVSVIVVVQNHRLIDGFVLVY